MANASSISRARFSARARPSTVGANARRPGSRPPPPVRDSAAITRFSSTVIDPNSSRRWNVRPTPRRARRWGDHSVTSVPNRRTRPEAGVTRPATLLNSVVLPAPFGPMSPAIDAGGTVSETRSSAVRPPKRTVMSSASSGGGPTTQLRGRAAYHSQGVAGEALVGEDPVEVAHTVTGLHLHHRPAVEDPFPGEGALPTDLAAAVSTRRLRRAEGRRTADQAASGEVLEFSDIVHDAIARRRCAARAQGLHEHLARAPTDERERRRRRARDSLEGVEIGLHRLARSLVQRHVGQERDDVTGALSAV